MIEAPFVMEGMIQGTAGGVLSIAALWLGYQLMRKQVPLSFSFFGFSNSLRFLDPQSVALIIAIGCVLGAAGSLFSLRRFLRTWKG
jgi:cell division transport system permease protein